MTPQKINFMSDKNRLEETKQGKSIKKHIFAGMWYLNEYDNRVNVICVHDGWCMVQEVDLFSESGNKRPKIESEEFLLAMFNQ